MSAAHIKRTANKREPLPSLRAGSAISVAVAVADEGAGRCPVRLAPTVGAAAEKCL